jgi:hypothetical protein
MGAVTYKSHDLGQPCGTHIYGPHLGDTLLAREELGMEFHSLEDTLRAASDGQCGHFHVAMFVCLENHQ